LANKKTTKYKKRNLLEKSKAQKIFKNAANLKIYSFCEGQAHTPKSSISPPPLPKFLGLILLGEPITWFRGRIKISVQTL